MAKTEVVRHQRQRPVRGLAWLLLLVLLISAAVNLTDPHSSATIRGIGLAGMLGTCVLSYWLGRTK